MKVKRYIVDDLPEAVKLIRSELGSDAVILNTKDIRIGGFLGMFSKKRVEVIAAVDEGANQASRSAQPIARPQERQQATIPVQLEELAASSALLPSHAIREKYSQAPFSDSGRNRSVETQATKLAAAVQTLESRDSIPEKEDASALMQELRTMKEMMTKMAKQQTYRSMPESVMKWSKRLAEQGVDPAYVEQFAEEMNQLLQEQEQGEDEVKSTYKAAQTVVLSWLKEIQGQGIDKNTRIVHFVGPTGVGKTTTIAKLAADQSFSHNRDVGFITADTYRIAAVDQLRTYADILNIPLEVVFSPSELTRAYKKLNTKDLIFMDTAGRNYRNELFVSEVNSLLSPGEQKETILVLSMTHKYRDMKLVASQFAKYGVNQLLLTKFDETDSFGAIINLAKEFDFRISYITCGQTVPDDIRPFDLEDLVRRLLGDPDDE